MKIIISFFFLTSILPTVIIMDLGKERRFDDDDVIFPKVRKIKVRDK